MGVRKRDSAHAVGSRSHRALDSGRASPDSEGVGWPYHAWFDSAPVAMVVVDDHGRCVAVNAAACEFIGRHRDELLGENAFSWFAECPATVPSANDGAAVTVRLADRPVSLVVSRLNDQTELWTLQEAPGDEADVEAMRRSLAVFSTLVDVCHACVISSDGKGNILTWNAAAEELFGYTAAEAVGLPVVSLIASPDVDLHNSAFASMVASRPARPIARVVHADARCKDGREFAAEVSVAVAPGSDGPLLTAVVRDVSDERRMLDELNHALQLLRFHVARMPLAYIVWDVDFRVTEWNPAAERIFGYSKDEAMGRDAYELVVPKDVHGAVASIWSDLLHGDTSSHSINGNNRKDGSRIVCEWFNTPLRDSRGRVHGVASMAMDVSEREAMEARIRDTQKIESLGVLASGIAHDFNSALMIIQGNAALLRACEGLPERSREFIDLIEQAGDRADELIKHLLTYARTGRHNPDRIDINEVIQDSLNLVHSSLGNEYPLVVDLAESLPLIEADRSQVEQVLLNVVLNARAASPVGGEIRVRTLETTLSRAEALRCLPHESAPGGYVELRVSDDGCGMDEATVSRMFDPFFTTKPEGHGLGMAAVLGILRQHRGAALVKSQPGSGTTIRIFFPITKSTWRAGPQIAFEI